MEVVNNKGRNYCFYLVFVKELKNLYLADKGTVFSVINLV